MHAPADIQVIAAPSILGLKPGGVERLPDSLLSNHLLEKIRSVNPVIRLPVLNHYYIAERKDGHDILNEGKLGEFFVTLKQRVSEAVAGGKFPLVLGGDCSILIGAIAGLESKENMGLFFMDAHADCYLPEQSPTGEAADMELAVISGNMPGHFANIDGSVPYLEESHIIHIGQRDQEETARYGALDIRGTKIKCFDHDTIQSRGLPYLFDGIGAYTARLHAQGYWIHFDTDVIADDENPAVDYRLKGGLTFQQCSRILQWLTTHAPVIGMTVTIFNADMDTTGVIAQRLTECLVNALKIVET